MVALYDDSLIALQADSLIALQTDSLIALQVNLCFQRIAADILGIKLSRAEVESQHRIVKAEITNYSKKEAGMSVVQAPKSTMCSIQ